ncbi:hypothetical protein BDZ85DRAFT_281256 [Elsinoe ampelina]|uniref:Uncharacterized protein n=1 Tax=Elsinoe ampelina TaxID=302913 RepID=A0A6A6GCG2_9PEZI|nr:hypothetical protein BDZ85DRAFT_281256 [Elsinoe ampelina]
MATSVTPSQKRVDKGDALASVMDSALSIHDSPQVEGSSDSDGDEPPPYMASPSPASAPAPAPVPNSTAKPPDTPEIWRIYEKLQKVPWAKYMPPSAQLSADASTVTIVNVPQDHNAELVSKIIVEQLSLRPQQFVRIQGRHQTWGESKKVPDFDITLNLTPYFLDDTGSIILTRHPTNLYKPSITTSLAGLMSYLHFKGDLEVTFPTTSTKVIINLPALPPPPGADPPKRKSLFSSLVGTVTGEKTSYSVKAEWPFASHPVEVDDFGGVFESPERTFTTKSEKAWYQDWEALIRRAVVRKQTTSLGVDTWMQNMTDPLRKAELPTTSWAVHAYT